MSAYGVVFVGRNASLLEYLTFRDEIEIDAAYFPPGRPETPHLVTTCELRAIHYCCAANSDEIWADLRKREPADLGLCSGFERLRGNVYSHPSGGFVNIHPSLLPKYKGRTPLVHMLLNNEKYCGVSLHIMTDQIDTGGILAQKRIPIWFRDNLTTLETKINQALFDLLDLHLVSILEKKVTPIGNASDAGGYTTPIRTRLGFRFTDEPTFIYNSIRSQAVYGGCVVQHNGHPIEILEAYLDHYDSRHDVTPGTVCFAGSDGVIVALKNRRYLRLVQWHPREVAFHPGETLA